MTDTLAWLECWYLSQCDGDWEHQQGIHMDTLDNPGWMVSISLEETDLDGLPFEPLEVHRSEDDWLFCRVRERKFEAACGPRNLNESLKVFRAWVERSGPGPVSD